MLQDEEDSRWGEEDEDEGTGTSLQHTPREIRGGGAPSMRQIAGWALGRVMGKGGGGYSEEETLAACRAVSEEIGVRAGFFEVEDNKRDKRRKNGVDPCGVHVFFGDLDILEAIATGSELGVGAASRMEKYGWDALDRGEGGVAPLLRGDFSRLINVSAYENASLPKQCSAWGFSTSWSIAFESSWKRLMSKAQTLHSQGSLVDFCWGPVGDIKTHAAAPEDLRQRRTDGVTVSAIPMDFEPARPDEPGSRDGWRMKLGCSTSGTCFRSASRERCPPQQSWRFNAIANLYYCPVKHTGRVVLNIVRHGVVGFSREPSGHLNKHLGLLVRHVLQRQCLAGLPNRIISVNLLSHYKASGEPDMTDRQLHAFQEIIRKINAKHLGSDAKEEGGLPKDLPVVQYGQLLLPANTDQWEMGADYNRRKNVDCAILYLQWVCDDVVYAIRRLMTKSGYSAMGPTGPGGVHLASIDSSSAKPHWSALQREYTQAIQKALVCLGCADKAAITDCITCAGQPLDQYFKSFLLIPIVSSSDDQVWETLVDFLPEYLKKRIESHWRSLRAEADADGINSRSMEVVRQTVALVRHILQILSATVCLVYRRLINLSPKRLVSEMSLSPQQQAWDATKSDQSESPDDAKFCAPAPSLPTDKQEEAVESDLEDSMESPPLSRSLQEERMREVVQEHLQELERARIAINALRTLVQAELGFWEGGYMSDSRAEDSDQSQKRRFSRVTSMSAAALLNQSLGVVVFTNCKSGLDRTGLLVGMQTCISSLWTLYPRQRWGLHLAAINSHLFQARNSSGDEIFLQPSTWDEFGNEQEKTLWVKSIFRERTMVRNHRLQQLNLPQQNRDASDRESYSIPPKYIQNVPLSDDCLLFEDSTRMLKALFPLKCLMKNFMVNFLSEANAIITFASTGVRGMKYENHPLLGALIPRDVRVSSKAASSKFSSERDAPYRLSSLHSRQYLGLKSLAGGKLAQDTLTDLGR